MSTRFGPLRRAQLELLRHSRHASALEARELDRLTTERAELDRKISAAKAGWKARQRSAVEALVEDLGGAIADGASVRDVVEGGETFLIVEDAAATTPAHAETLTHTAPKEGTNP